MTFIQAVETIGRLQEDVTDKVLLGEEPYPPDEYFVAVSKILPYLRCLECISRQAVKDSHGTFIPCCNAGMDTDADELPFG